ncbi:OmpA family protein [Arenimonas sp.]|uniref:OmpA family protein n=1 Tax=Arenimonas sp. TaxID=1872635 RepID=UPI002E330B7A|nr:OmpA family protein [Arenimonas sp.]HEX4854809.1 OmpA family protein [Arenimonas sp.]
MRLLPLLIASTLLLTACGQQDAAPAADAAPGAADTAAATATPESANAPAAGPLPGEPGAADAAATGTSTPVQSNATPLPGEPGGPDLAAAAPPTEFDPASVPESSASLPPFPFFKEPEGLVSTLGDRDRNKNFDREHMIAGDKVVAIEGKVFRDRFQLTNPEQREYSDIEFHRNYANAIAELGGQKINQVQYTNQVNAAFGGREAVDKHYHGTCASDGCENHTYLIRQGGKEWWIQVSTGAIPLHGEVVVLERQGMTSKLAFIDAAAMKKALDADGRIALYINFDVDKATLRPDAAAVVTEIHSLLSNDPALRLSIDGHTDSTGTAERNRELSRQRAEAVQAALVAKGIAADRLQAQGFGPDQPLADNATEDGRAKNRRVELVRLP